MFTPGIDFPGIDFDIRHRIEPLQILSSMTVTYFFEVKHLKR